jgi:hypothetical protein
LSERRLGGTYRFHFRGDKLGAEARFEELLGIFLCRVLRCATANVVPSLSILVTLMMETVYSFETLVLAAGAQHSIPEDGILHSHHRKKNNLTEL